MEFSCTKCVNKSNPIQCKPVDRQGTSLQNLTIHSKRYKDGRNLPCWKHYRIFTKSIASHNVTIDDLTDYDALRQAKHDTRYLVMIKSPFAWLTSDALYHHHRTLTEDMIHKYISEWHNYTKK